MYQIVHTIAGKALRLQMLVRENLSNLKSN
jgi:hypothetical protein